MKLLTDDISTPFIRVELCLRSTYGPVVSQFKLALSLPAACCSNGFSVDWLFRRPFESQVDANDSVPGSYLTTPGQQ